ncbi:MAG: F0F1 ATP synthase subunit A [Synergistaceae bacterium]|nr:F0F1 ATP synthase subunit A [Synergistaceae bacterium]
MDFSIKNLWVINVGGVDVWITETIINTWIVMLFLIVFAVIVRTKLKKFSDVPAGFQNVIEMIVEAFDGFVRSCAGEKLMFLGNWFFMVFLFILTSNLSGLLGFRPPTADWTVTFTFAIVTFALIQVMGFKFRKGGYIKGFFEPYAIFFPLNVIGELARPISLSFRLFGNILGGMILMTLIYALAPFYLRFVLPAALHAYFDLIAAILQTYIFCVLSLTFIGAMAGTND